MTAASDKTPVIDPISVEVIGNSLASIVEEMGESLVRASYSTNIKERRDCSTALFNADGETLCQAEHIPLHLGSFIGCIPHIMRQYPVETLQPGDVFIANDAFEGGGTHLPDIVIAEPIFHAARLIGWAVNLAHHADFVDRGHAHIYQEGLRIPPVRLYAAGELQADIQKLILLNCQVPTERLADLRAQLAANRLGVQRMIALCDKYGVNLVLAAGTALQAYAERKMRNGIAAIPDGTYAFSDVFENPELEEHLPISVRITVKGDEMLLAFDAPAQVRASVNMTYTALLATVYYSVKSIVDPTSPPKVGLTRPLKVEAPKGSLLNCVEPAAVDGRIGPSQRVVDLIHGALAQAVPEQVVAACNGACAGTRFIGQRPEDGSTWIYVESIGGGFGARHNKDGLDGVHVHMTNTSNLPIEALELEYPLRVLRYELVDNSGGIGRYRGGMALRRVYRAEADCWLQIEATRITSAPWGLDGGGAGASALNTATTGEFVNGNVLLSAKGIATIQTPGAGGRGKPEDRNRAAVEKDLRDGRIDAQTAQSAYRFTS